eukprot:TRINITY_DN15471_c0_g1_i1.p1 TRINITY_DN15471_c0_g1~~TRINITY_DN15471_c0_g1_i1.p1  ORF type:complete len:350 (-),score=96.41 TRINITY_DN15471_c0_g1_i1:152-1201(-)
MQGRAPVPIMSDPLTGYSNQWRGSQNAGKGTLETGMQETMQKLMEIGNRKVSPTDWEMGYRNFELSTAASGLKRNEVKINVSSNNNNNNVTNISIGANTQLNHGSSSGLTSGTRGLIIGTDGSRAQVIKGKKDEDYDWIPDKFPDKINSTPLMDPSNKSSKRKRREEEEMVVIPPPSPDDGRNKRKRKSPGQLELLETEFAQNPMPNKEVREQLGMVLGLSNRQVQIWFQNRRAKVKNNGGRIAKKKDLTPLELEQLCRIRDKAFIMGRGDSTLLPELERESLDYDENTSTGDHSSDFSPEALHFLGASSSTSSLSNTISPFFREHAAPESTFLTDCLNDWDATKTGEP